MSLTTEVIAVGSIRGKGNCIKHSTDISTPSIAYEQTEMGRQSTDRVNFTLKKEGTTVRTLRVGQYVSMEFRNCCIDYDGIGVN